MMYVAQNIFTSLNPEADATIWKLVARIGPDKFLHYKCFPLGFMEDGKTIRLAFSKQTGKPQMMESARAIAKLVRKDGEKGSAKIYCLEELTMKQLERQLDEFARELKADRINVSLDQRLRAAEVRVDEGTMQFAKRMISETHAFEHDIIGLAFDVDRQEILIGSDDDSAQFVDTMRGVLRYANVLIRKMPVGEIRDLQREIYTKAKSLDPGSDMKRTLDAILAEALNRGCNDVAFEFSEAEGRGRVRFAVDDDFEPCRRFPILEADEYRRLVSIIREEGNVKPSDANECGDGRLERMIEGRQMNLRVNTMPYRNGTTLRVSMRILSDMAELRRLEDLGLSGHVFRQFRRAMRRPGAFNVIAGPVGEGKTTTGYTLLKTFVDFDQKNVMSLEDPIEYPIPGINQFLITADERQVEETGKGNSFARLLRASMRAYPHVIYLGEIRDNETASEAMRAATTGISLLATIHASDAVQTLTRLKTFNVTRWDLAQNLKMAASQRLVRRLCDNCKVATTTISREAADLAFKFSVDLISIYKAKENGCRHCGGKGYSDRIAAFEVLEVNAAIADAIEDPETGMVRIAQIAIEHGYRPMAVAALEHLAEGRTSEEAILRKLSFADAQRYIKPGTSKVAYTDPEEQIVVEEFEKSGSDVLGGGAERSLLTPASAA